MATMKPKMREIRTGRRKNTRFTRKQAAAAVKAVIAMRERGEFDQVAAKLAAKTAATARK